MIASMLQNDTKHDIIMVEVPMKAMMIRNIDDETFTQLKLQCEKLKTSMNRLIVSILQNVAGVRSRESEASPFDKYFGSWSQAEYKKIDKAISQNRKIDEELWK